MSPRQSPPDITSFSAPFEVPRRLLLVLALVVAVGLATWHYTGPFLKVETVDFTKKQQSLNRWLSSYESLSKLPMTDFIAYETKDKLISVSDGEWQTFFTAVSKSFADNAPVSGWERRISAEELKKTRAKKSRWNQGYKNFYHLYFRPDEKPINQISNLLQSSGTYYLELKASPPRYLEIYYSSGERASIGQGFYGKPTALTHPYRQYSLWVLLGGLLLYIILPWPQSAPNLLEFSRWRIILMDFAATFLLFGVFFAMPLLVVGGALEAVTDYWYFTLIFWSLAFLGALLIYYAIYYGAYRILVLSDRLQIITYKGKQEMLYSAIAFRQGAVIRPPKWLIILSFIAAFAGKGAARLGQLGRASILSASESGGWYLKTADNRSAYVWFTDQMGSIAVKNLDRLNQALDMAQIPVKEELQEIREIFPPTK